MAKKLTPRGRNQRWMSSHRGCYEQPSGSNRDQRKDGITAAQKRLADFLVGLAWCGVWVANGLIAGGVAGAHNTALAGVANCEDLARSHRAPFGRGWISSPSVRGSHWKRVFRGDAAVMFGRGIHIETIRSTAWIYRVRGYIITDGGNTSPEGGSGSQANGGTSARRKRPISSVYGICLADYPSK